MTQEALAPAAPRLWALLPCAGRGSRAACSVPKQYQMLAGRPVVLHTVAAFAAVSALARIVVVVAPGDDFLRAWGPGFEWADCGAATRAQSVLNGLHFLRDQLGAREADWVLVHDAARCLITPAQIEQLIAACAADAVGGLLALPLADTLKSATPQNRVVGTLSRQHKWLAQTPQMFRLGLLLQALRQAGEWVSDESSAIEALGLQPLLLPGSAQNFKLTYPADFALAESLLLARQAAEAGQRFSLFDK